MPKVTQLSSRQEGFGGRLLLAPNESVLLIICYCLQKNKAHFYHCPFASSILSLFLLLFCLLRGPHWSPLLGLCLSTLNSLCKICSLICILFNFTCWQILVLKSPALSLVLCDTVTDLFICLISDQRNGTGSPESDPDIYGHWTDDRGGSAEQ